MNYCCKDNTLLNVVLKTSEGKKHFSKENVAEFQYFHLYNYVILFYIYRISVRLGEYNTETDVDCVDNGYSKECAPAPLDVPVEERIAHEDYDPLDTNQYHDIALLRLSKEVTYSSNI